jgi:hypothetical protein
MATIPSDVLHVSEANASVLLSELPVPFSNMFARGDDSVELFAPRSVDTQKPHTGDELYIVSSGSGVFRRDLRILSGRFAICTSPCRSPL